MSTFSGTYGKGAMRQHKDKRYEEAIARQCLLLHIGTYIRRDHFGPGLDVIAFPAPIEKFLRRGDAVAPDGRPYTPRKEVEDGDRPADQDTSSVQDAGRQAGSAKRRRNSTT